LKYAAKYLKANDRKRYEAVVGFAGEIEELAEDAKDVDGEGIEAVRERLLGLEGNAGRRYWEGIKLLLKDVEFCGREHRGAVDLVNSLLNYGYGILYSKVWGALMNAGLEPFAGFLHTDRPGKPSLVLDCIEEFRQPVVDRGVLALVNKRVKLEMEDGLLTPKTMKILAEKILERLDEEVAYEGRQCSLGSVIQAQARHLAMFFRDERSYRCYRFRW
jgi:CRISPR-associated protein Cas1